MAVVAVQIGPAERTYESSVDESFAASVTPIADESNDTGSELSSMLGGADARIGSASLVATLDSMIGDANEAVGQFETLSTPPDLTGAASSCLSALESRARILGTFRSSVATLVSMSATDAGRRSDEAQAESSIEHLGLSLGAADESWSDCRSAMLDAPGRSRNSVPSSVWVGPDPAWEQASVVSFIDDLTQSAPLVPTPPLVITAVSASPPAVVTLRGVDELPVTSTLTLHVVVADKNNLEEKGVVATVSLTPVGATGDPASSSSEASIGPGQAFSFHPRALEVSPGASYTLEVTVTGPGQSAPAVRSYRISVDSSNGVTTSR
ncbi:MAG: hypothetical protein ACLP6E_16730 [Acidimicrobiales bacterium]